MKKVLMVCLGNICRSPLAEGILNSKVDKNDVTVDSAGTGGWHIGELPDSRSIEVAKNHQLDLSLQRCRKFSYSDFENFDIIYVMDKSNYKDVISIARNERDKQKVQLILNEVYTKQNLDVPDPYYGGDNGFENVYRMLDEACEVISKKLLES
ncbi:MAG: low molecular weight phosphotyrosine protein phosphatase [Flavobacteriaceae bacterium]|nr:low molecular weight phosphotyrosine protein phosphatase [Flavobacteriaceae bacterium]